MYTQEENQIFDLLCFFEAVLEGNQITTHAEDRKWDSNLQGLLVGIVYRETASLFFLSCPIQLQKEIKLAKTK
jgi:hypothetical protein